MFSTGCALASDCTAGGLVLVATMLPRLSVTVVVIEPSALADVVALPAPGTAAVEDVGGPLGSGLRGGCARPEAWTSATTGWVVISPRLALTAVLRR